MGYWEEKQEYKERLVEELEKEMKRKFCNSCGKKLTSKNIKGMCFKCKEIICNSCGTIYNKKITCIDCNQNIEDNYKKREREKGVIPIWVVIIGFFFYIIPGIILLLIRTQQLEKKEKEGKK